MTNKPTHHGAIVEAIEYIRKVKEIFLVNGQDPVVLQKLEALRDAVPDWRKDRLHPMQAEGKSYKLLHEALQESEG